MSSLKVNQISTKLRSMFESHLELSDISPSDAERDVKILSRCLAALAVYLESGCSEKEAAASVWDGADDNGIDAAYFDVSDSRVLLVQSKWIQKGAGEPEAKEIGTFVKGAKDVIEQEAAEFHQRLQHKLSDIAPRIATPGTRVQLVLVSTGASALARHGMSRLEDLLQELNNNDPDPIASARVMGLAEVYAGLANDPLLGSVNLEATLQDWSSVSQPYQAYFGVIDGLQLKSWWKTFGKRVVAANIRHSLGATEVNSEIKNTANSSPEKFWYFNNGITLVAEEATRAPAGAASRSAGTFSFKGASIVNGAQTVSTLAHVDNDLNLGVVRVPIRIILLKGVPPGFGGEVTRTNNLQNRIEPRDFVAQDPEQKRLRSEMGMEGVEYQFVRSDETGPTERTCELIELTTALACASGDSSLAVQIKTGSGRFFADLQKAPYKAIFNPQLSGARAFNAVMAHRRIEAWIELMKLSLPKRSGPAWGVLVHGNRVLAAAVFKKLGGVALAKPIAEFSEDIKSIDFAAMSIDAYKKILAGVHSHYVGKFLAVLFKNPTMSKHLFDLATA